jgi:hypothetical protein
MKTSTLIAFVLAIATASPVLARGGGGFGGGMGGGFGGGMGGGFGGGMGGGFGGGMGGGFGGMGGGGFGGPGGRNNMRNMRDTGGIDLRALGNNANNTRDNTRTNTRSNTATVTPTNNTSRTNRTAAATPTTPLRSNGSGQRIQLSNDYAILDTTSIFAQNRRAVSSSEVNPADVQPVVFRGASPVVRAAMIDDLGPLALLEVQQRDGSLAALYVRKGDTVEYANAKVLDVTLEYLRLSRASTGEGSSAYFDVPVGRNLDGQISGVLPATLVNQSLDALGATQNQNYGRNNRGGRGGGTYGGNFGGGNFGGNYGGNFGGGNYGGGYNNYAGGLGALVGGGTTAVSVTNTVVNPNLDPPLPPGTNDDIAARMAARRQTQLNSSPAPAPVSTPASAPAAASSGRISG